MKMAGKSTMDKSGDSAVKGSMKESGSVPKEKATVASSSGLAAHNSKPKKAAGEF